jgi:hypothetical protein
VTTQQTTISQDVEVLHQGFAGQIPDEVLSHFVAEQAGLDEAGVPASAAAPGP